MYPTSFQTDGKGRDLIHYAVANRNPDILEFLIQKRQIINNTDNEGITPMMIACKLNRIKSVQLLLEDQQKQQATLDPKDKDYQHYASFYSYMDTSAHSSKLLYITHANQTRSKSSKHLLKLEPP